MSAYGFNEQHDAAHAISPAIGAWNYAAKLRPYGRAADIPLLGALASTTLSGGAQSLEHGWTIYDYLLLIALTHCALTQRFSVRNSIARLDSKI